LVSRYFFEGNDRLLYGTLSEAGGETGTILDIGIINSPVGEAVKGIGSVNSRINGFIRETMFMMETQPLQVRGIVFLGSNQANCRNNNPHGSISWSLVKLRRK